jgi:hypothetical protein
MAKRIAPKISKLKYASAGGMEDYLMSMAVSVILSTIKLALKNPAKAASLKAALLKIRAQIDILYPGE